MKKKRRLNENKMIIKFIIYITSLILITLVSLFAYNLYIKSNNDISFSESKSTSEYSYINISKMSEKFAYYENANIGLHFVIEKEDTGEWHTYIIAINEDEIDKYQEIINYTKGETDSVPNPIKVYGYPVNVDDNLKTMAISNINNFLPSTNEVIISNDNYEEYLTNSYLDTTLNKQEELNIPLIISLFIILFIVLHAILTFIDKSPIQIKLEKDFVRTRKILKRKH